MNTELKESFSRIKPICDVVMVCPSAESISKFVAKVAELKKDVVQELQQYLLFPFITHLKSTEMEKKYELQWRLIDGMRVVLEKVVVNSFEMCMKIETSLLQLVFDNAKPGMIAEVPEELKHSVMKCLTVLMLNIDKRFRERLMKSQVPLIAQAVFVSVHIAKLEKMRVLRIAAINCVTAHTATHHQLTNDKYRIPDAKLEMKVVDMLSSILPGVLAALQDVATCTNNPGHAVVVASIEAIHRILCLTMQDEFISENQTSAKEFYKIFTDQKEKEEVSCKEKPLKEVPKRSHEWYAMAGEKLTLITKSLISLRTHEHFKVRKELAVFCSRVLNECTITMQPSMPVVLDILISLSKDAHPVVSEYCAAAVNGYFVYAPPETRHRTMDNLSENLFVMLNGLPRVLNNIDSGRKLYALNLLHGYLTVMCDEGRPQRLTVCLSAHNNMRRMCNALREAAALDYDLALLTYNTRPDMSTPPLTPATSTPPWCKLRHLEPGLCSQRLQDVLSVLGAAECGELMLDRLLELFHQDRGPDLPYIINCMARAPNSSQSFVQRILDAYIEEDVWYSPLEVVSDEPPVTAEETLDVTVYNPRAWTKDSVPGLYEGTVETRYTDIGYSRPRVTSRSTGACNTLAEAQRNMALSCLLTEGLGIIAQRLGEAYQPYLLKTLCLILERVGSKYALLHQAGLLALQGVAAAGNHGSVAALVAHNADYFTHQVTVRLKKSWNSESALQILSVVMEYSDASILDCLYGIVRDVLVQSCDKYYEKNLHSYLKVFLTFVNCINKWFPVKEEYSPTEVEPGKLDIMKDLFEYIRNTEEAERLLSNEEFEKETGKSVEEMYREDMKNKEDNVLDYDDRVTEEKPPLPQHTEVTLLVLERCSQFLGGTQAAQASLAFQLLSEGLPQLSTYPDQLLPLVHRIWAPLVARFQINEPVVMRRALSLLETMAELSKDFIHSRCVKEVLPQLCQHLQQAASESLLKDAGSYYRSSPAYGCQVATLAALHSLALDLGLRDEQLEKAMQAASPYLSNKQPKPLQAIAVYFFKNLLNYDSGAAWYHLRTLCNNTREMAPPRTPLTLHTVRGSPYEPVDNDYEENIKLIFDFPIS